jgi:hypothetical protein
MRKLALGVLVVIAVTLITSVIGIQINSHINLVNSYAKRDTLRYNSLSAYQAVGGTIQRVQCKPNYHIDQVLTKDSILFVLYEKPQHTLGYKIVATIGSAIYGEAANHVIKFQLDKVKQDVMFKPTEDGPIIVLSTDSFCE